MNNKFVICRGLAALVLLAPFLDRAKYAQQASTETICKLISHPDKYLGTPVTVRVKVKIYRHGTAISDRACPKQFLLLTDKQQAAGTEALSHFHEVLAEHRRFNKPIFATITGRLVKGQDGGFVLKRDVVFEIESASEISEDDRAE